MSLQFDASAIFFYMRMRFRKAEKLSQGLHRYYLEEHSDTFSSHIEKPKCLST